MPRTHGTEIVKAKGKSDFPTIERFISSELDKYTGLKINFNRSHLDYAATIINNELELEGDASLDGNDFFKLISMNLAERHGDNYYMANETIKLLNKKKAWMDKQDKVNNGTIHAGFTKKRLQQIRGQYFQSVTTKATHAGLVTTGISGLLAGVFTGKMAIALAITGIVGLSIVPVMAVGVGLYMKHRAKTKNLETDTQKARSLADSDVHRLQQKEFNKAADWDHRFKQTFSKTTPETTKAPQVKGVRLDVHIGGLHF